MEMERIMMKTKHIPNEYWVEGVACVIYILNRSPTNRVKDKVPHEAWSNKNHNVSDLKVIGCIAYAHVPNENMKKLDNKEEICLFMGYSEQSKAYKLYNPITKRTIISRYVKFLEYEEWIWNGNLHQ